MRSDADRSTPPFELEEALRASDERFRLLVAGVRDYAIFLLDTEGNVSSWNEGAQRIKLYTEEEILGRHFSIFYPRAEIDSRKPWRELEIAVAEGSFEEEGWRLRKDGRRFWASVVITALHGPEGELAGFAKVTRDLTERRRNQRRLDALRRREMLKLREHARRMSDLETAKSDFLRLASHELRGPLTVIRGFTTMLAEGTLGELSEDAHRGVAIMLAKSDEANAIVDQLLETARIEEGRLTLRRERTDLRDLVGATAERLRPLLSARHRLVVDLPDAPALVDIDRERLRTVLGNLLDNALKYSPGGGLIRCTVRDESESGQVTVDVTDEGIGIGADEMPRLFTRFGRLVNAENSHIPGTGLGLHLSRELVRRHGGELTATSEPGRGTRFHLLLPRAHGS
ncbi:MAG: PAS domain S-box protein [Chloroflexi bacterium]|nr:MAG: PAS domain S-box protein [Chloroflexota bacterium]